MNFAYRLFLGMKHWHLFLLFVGLWVVWSMSAIASISKDPLKINLLSEAAIVLLVCCFLGWCRSIVSFCTSIVHPTLRPKMWLFRFAVVYPVLYIPVFIWFVQLPTTEIYVSILLLHFLAMFCMFYCLRFVAKSLVECEMGKSASFYDYGGPFFLIWFFPIGIWFVQPRVNRLYATRTSVALQSETNVR